MSFLGNNFFRPPFFLLRKRKGFPTLHETKSESVFHCGTWWHVSFNDFQDWEDFPASLSKIYSWVKDQI